MTEFENCISATGKGVHGVTPDKVTFHATMEKQYRKKEELSEHMSTLGAKCQKISQQLDQIIDSTHSSYQVLPSASSDSNYLRTSEGKYVTDAAGDRVREIVYTASYRFYFILETEGELTKVIQLMKLLEEHQLEFGAISYDLRTQTRLQAHDVALQTAVQNAIHNCTIVSKAAKCEFSRIPHQITIGSRAVARSNTSSFHNECAMALSSSSSDNKTFIKKPKEIKVEGEVTVHMKIKNK